MSTRSSILKNGGKSETSSSVNAATQTYHHLLDRTDKVSKEFIWEVQQTIPYDELIVSWNALRPQNGGFTVSVSVKLADWSPWFPYAYWGSKGQWGGDISSADHSVEIHQDILSINKECQATGFRVRIEAVDDAVLDEFYSVHACVSRVADLLADKTAITGPSIDLSVPLVSQMSLSHLRKKDMCSPVSTSAAISYLLKRSSLDPLAFAQHVHDDLFDIFGNWVLNAAQAASILGNRWSCWVERLAGFHEIYKQLQQGVPVVVSVRGPLAGSASPYLKGHLVVVKGFRPEDNSVLCMDPAFSNDQSTNVSYPLSDFIAAWSRRQFIAYLFQAQK